MTDDARKPREFWIEFEDDYPSGPDKWAHVDDIPGPGIHVREVIEGDINDHIIELIRQRSVAWDECKKYRELAAELAKGLEKIAFPTEENSNFSKSEDEAQYYIDLAKEALARYREAVKGDEK